MKRTPSKHCFLKKPAKHRTNNRWKICNRRTFEVDYFLSQFLFIKCCCRVCKIAKQGKGIPKSTKNCFQGLFQDIHCDSSVFQETIKFKNISRFKDAKQNFKTFSQNPTKIQDFLTPTRELNFDPGIKCVYGSVIGK